MKLLYLHSQKTRIDVGVHTPREVERLQKKLGSALPLLDGTNHRAGSENALVVLVSVEKGDGELDLGRVRDDILKGRMMVRAQDIIISSFAHLSDSMEEAGEAARVVGGLVRLVRTQYTATQEAPFGWNKTMELEVPAHGYSTSFRSFSSVASAWDEIADSYHGYMLRTGHYEAQHELLEALHEHVRGHVVEMGCGAGEVARWLYAHPVNGVRGYRGVDASAYMVEIARRNNVLLYGKAAGMPMEFIQGKVEEISGVFDTVLLCNMIAYADVGQIREAVRRVTAPVGKLILAEEDPFIPAFFKRYRSRAQRELEKRGRMPIEEMKRVFGSEGWEQIDETWVPIDSVHGLRGMVFARKDDSVEKR